MKSPDKIKKSTTFQSKELVAPDFDQKVKMEKNKALRQSVFRNDKGLTEGNEDEIAKFENQEFLKN